MADKAVFVCMECGKLFNTLAASQRAASEGCPKCGSCDIDVATPSTVAKTIRSLVGAT